MLYSNSKRVDAERMSVEIIVLKDRILRYQETVKGLQRSLKSSENTKKAKGILRSSHCRKGCHNERINK